MRNLFKVAAAAMLIASVALTGLAATSPKKENTTPTQSNTAPIRANGYSSGGGGGSSSGGGGGTGSIGSVYGTSLSASNTVESAPTVTGHWDFDGTYWHYVLDSGSRIAGQFAYLENPYAGGAVQLFYFDTFGNMLTNWQWIRNANGLRYCYYFNPVSNGSLGAAQQGGTTPDGWQVNSAAAWTVEGVAQTK